MKTYGRLLLLSSVVFLALFGLVEALGVPLLTDPRPWLERGRPLAAAVGLFLLVGDVLLPVPASLVMVAHGALFGVALGTLLSVAGSLGASAFGFYLGRIGSPLLIRSLSPEERRKADDLLARWGLLAVVVTRPIPILAESVALLAGTTALPWPRYLLASLSGLLPASFLYAVTGATAARLDSFLLIFALVLAVAGLFWLIGRRLAPPAPAASSSPPSPSPPPAGTMQGETPSGEKGRLS